MSPHRSQRFLFFIWFIYLDRVTLSSSCAPSGLQEELGQHHAGQPRPGDLLQVLLREKVWPQRLRLRPGGRDPKHGPRGAAGNQTWRVSRKSRLAPSSHEVIATMGVITVNLWLIQGSQKYVRSVVTVWFRSSVFLIVCCCFFFQAIPHFFFLLCFISVYPFVPQSRTWHRVNDQFKIRKMKWEVKKHSRIAEQCQRPHKWLWTQLAALCV